ncbi:hypothetical protein CH252_04945 [Rhodococcus sp. 06-1477-1B]|nr:hypothetical protein CH252_04945 [Rhodococcus sp. 06-1477-1B]
MLFRESIETLVIALIQCEVFTECTPLPHPADILQFSWTVELSGSVLHTNHGLDIVVSFTGY